MTHKENVFIHTEKWTNADNSENVKFEYQQQTATLEAQFSCLSFADLQTLITSFNTLLT